MADGRPDAIAYRWIDQQHELDEIAADWPASPRYALDTEFHRERTYYPKLALVQIAWETPSGQDLVLIDPLAVDVSSLVTTFASDACCVFHAAQQDLDVLTHAVGSIPRQMVDTQIAAGFVGYGTPSLVSLLQGEIDITPAKGDRLTDWLRRPLSDSQRQYAAVDVEYLLRVYDGLARSSPTSTAWTGPPRPARSFGRRPVSGADPESAWLRLKDARSLRPKGRAVAQAVAAWRERRAMRTDIPVRQVLPDLAILGIAQRARRPRRSSTRRAASTIGTRAAGSRRRSSRRCESAARRPARRAAVQRRPRPQAATGGHA